MKRILFIVIVAIWNFSLWGQVKLNPQQQADIISKINNATVSISSMQCDFTQTKKTSLLKKEMVSSGEMYFRSPDKLRWQYKKPYSFIFILNGNNVSIVSAKKSQNIDVKRNKMFRQLSNIILNSVTGGHLRSTSDFDVQIWKESDKYTAKLFPKKKELKKLYKVIGLTFNSSLSMVETVKMEETTGDFTIVYLKNVKLNQNISEKLFNNN